MKLIENILYKIKLAKMDNEYYFRRQQCFSFAPPSYYHTHTPEEIDADYRHVKELISHFDDKDDSFFRENRTKKEKHISIYSKPFLYIKKAPLYNRAFSYFILRYMQNSGMRK